MGIIHVTMRVERAVGSAGSAAGGIAGHGDLGLPEAQRAGNDGNEQHADNSPAAGPDLTDDVTGDHGKIHAEEAEVHVDPALGQGDAQLLRGLHERDLAIGLQLRQTVLHGHGAVVRRHGDGGEVKARRAHRVDPRPAWPWS